MEKERQPLAYLFTGVIQTPEEIVNTFLSVGLFCMFYKGGFLSEETEEFCGCQNKYSKLLS